MRIGALISIVVATLAIAGVVAAFLGNASPYVGIAEAKRSTEAGVHVVGMLDKGSLDARIKEGTTRFVLTDEDGDRLPVRYEGPPVQNLTAADKVVVVGTCKSGVFEAEKIMVKCPSKYEGVQK